MAEAEDEPTPARAGARLRHDLRTPINQIIGYGEMLDEDAAEAGNERASADLRRIVAAARSLLELVDRVPDELGPPPVPSAGPAAGPASAASARPAGGTAETPAAPPVRRPAAPLPPSDDAPGPATLAIRAAVAKPVAGTGTLLVVDDNELNRDMLSRRLRSRGYAVVTAEDGQQALDLVKAQRFDLILLDIMMPVLSGLDVLKVIRN